jgi:uncharacterized membrane protein YeiB
MAAEESAPVSGRDRLTELDVIRGLALFGVLWMNLSAMSGTFSAGRRGGANGCRGSVRSGRWR